MAKLIIRVTLKVMAKEFLQCSTPNHPYLAPIWISKKVAPDARVIDSLLRRFTSSFVMDRKSWGTTPFS